MSDQVIIALITSVTAGVVAWITGYYSAKKSKEPAPRDRPHDLGESWYDRDYYKAEILRLQQRAKQLEASGEERERTVTTLLAEREELRRIINRPIQRKR